MFSAELSIFSQSIIPLLHAPARRVVRKHRRCMHKRAASAAAVAGSKDRLSGDVSCVEEMQSAVQLSSESTGLRYLHTHPLAVMTKWPQGRAEVLPQTNRIDHPTCQMESMRAERENSATVFQALRLLVRKDRNLPPLPENFGPGHTLCQITSSTDLSQALRNHDNTTVMPTSSITTNARPESQASIGQDIEG